MSNQELVDASTLEKLYPRRYYLDDCEGHQLFRSTSGRRLSRRLRKVVNLLAAKPGERIVDVGCGRGEVALQVARRGARAVALDPSPSAVRLTSEALAVWRREAPPEADLSVAILRARAEHLPLPSGEVDAVVLSDVVEHLPAQANYRLLREVRRVLRPGGRAVIHTQPNRRLLNFTIPVLARLSRLWGVRLPTDLRTEMTPGSGPLYHVNEQTRGDLKRSLRSSGFEIDALWLEGTYPLHRVFGSSRIKDPLLKGFRRSRWLKELFASQLFALARRPR